MRISDWSSDVCSSDLHAGCQCLACALGCRLVTGGGPGHRRQPCRLPPCRSTGGAGRGLDDHTHGLAVFLPIVQRPDGFGGGRSEEHTSELKSLMRISYAVFCLKKKNNTVNQNYI